MLCAPYREKAAGKDALMLCGCTFLQTLQQAKEYRMGYREIGVATWQGRYFHGRPTASGEIHNMFGLSAAHKNLSFGTLLRVTDLNAGRTVEVKVNER